MLRIQTAVYVTLLAILQLPAALAQPVPADPIPAEGYRPGIDVQHYRFDIQLFEDSNRIEAVADIDVRFTADTLTVLPLDLIAEDGRGTGMRVESVLEDGISTSFRHRGDRLEIALSSSPAGGSRRVYSISYAGIPADGLIIGENRHGRRTFFGDNWPNRARHWLASVDHPSDKAFFDWAITLPASYEVVANGRLREKSDMGDGSRRVRYTTTAPLATKIAVFGAAEFAVDVPAVVDGIPVESWVYPEDRDAGFFDFERAVTVLQVFRSLIGDYPFAKLANVQSTTRYGGMENASAIFYDENSVTGTRANEALIAHEVAHQWFGNAVTERDWPHLWLSEGFATYLTHVYFERIYGQDVRASRMAVDRQRVIDFAARHPDLPLVDSTYVTPMDLLNPNSYQKGGWVLHMLRQEIGDEAFFSALRAFYERHRGGNADTEDFRRVAEGAAGRDLRSFFEQWAHRPGVPRLSATWERDGSGIVLTVRQTQAGPVYDILLEVGLVSEEVVRIETIRVTSKEEAFALDVPHITGIVLDPSVHALAVLEQVLELSPAGR